MNIYETKHMTVVMKAIKYTFCAIFACIIEMHAAAAESDGASQSHESIVTAARQLMLDNTVSVYRQRPEISTGSLDSRLRLRKCSIPLKAFLPEGSRDLGRITVGVKCADDKPWSLYVPVTIRIFKQVVVTKRTLQRGAVLTGSDIKLASNDLADLNRGYFEDISQNLGMKLKRRLSAGEPLTPSMLEQPQIITRGQRVNILAVTGEMVVRSTGKAMDHGAAGDRIGVMNMSSKHKIEGVITKDGEVRVDM
jgi:flagellar basal body P-ring formation protein FlgA